MSYQKVTGPLMANSHPGSYCGQDAYNDMFVTEMGNEFCSTGAGSVQEIRTGKRIKTKGSQRRYRPHIDGEGGDTA